MWWMWKFSIDEKFHRVDVIRAHTGQRKSQRFRYYYSSDRRTKWFQVMPSSGIRRQETNIIKIRLLNEQLGLHRLLNAAKSRAH
jgi:hypothetical protein